MSSRDLDLRIAAARYVMGALPSWELPKIADGVLNLGIYSPAVGELATMRQPVMADAGPLFERALTELQTEMPSPEDAVWILLRHYIERIGSGDLTPRAGLSLIHDLYIRADLDERSRKYVGDSHGIQQLLGYFWGYDDLEERPTEVSFDGRYGADAIRALDEEVVRIARDWVGEHGANSSSGPPIAS